MSKTKIDVKALAAQEGVSVRTMYRRLNSAGDSTEQPAAEPSTQKVVEQKHKIEKPSPAKLPTSKVFLAKNLTVLFVSVLILLDGISFGYIGARTFSWAVSPVFFFAGLAVGYAAIRQVLTYRGWNGDAWMWGFALFQTGLHLCAMDVVPHSDIAGKVVIAVAVPLAVAGMADSMKQEQKSEK